VCGTYAHTFEAFQVYNKRKKYYYQLLYLDLLNEHGDLDHNMDYSKITFYVTMFPENPFSIQYDNLLYDFATLDYFRGKGITIPLCVTIFLNMTVNARFSKKDIVTGIIVWDDILIQECAHIEEISKNIYDCGGSVQRGLVKKGGKIVMSGIRKELGKKIGAPGEFKS
jgi:hypothetical protein